MEQDIYLGMKLVNVNVDYMQVFVMINNFGIMLNADVNAKNWLTKVDVTMDLFGILVYVNVNVTNHKIIQTINAEKD